MCDHTTMQAWLSQPPSYISVSIDGVGFASTSSFFSPSMSFSGGGGGLRVLVTGWVHDVVWVAWLPDVKQRHKTNIH